MSVVTACKKKKRKSIYVFALHYFKQLSKTSVNNRIIFITLEYFWKHHNGQETEASSQLLSLAL